MKKLLKIVIIIAAVLLVIFLTVFILAKMKDLCNFMKPFFYGNDKGFKDMCKADTVETFRVCMKQYIRNSKMNY